jgi:sugar lactone lactonase YvrE
MKKRIVAVLAALLAYAIPGSAQPFVAVPTGVAVGFEGSESAVWDAPTNAWYVSNNGDGTIAKLAPGAATPSVFATGLSAPQGIVIEGRTMYVADDDHVRRIDMADPTKQQATAVKDASLADLDVDPASGDVYTVELSAGKIWRLAKRVDAQTGDTTYQVELFLDFASPDGVYISQGGLFVTRFGIGRPGGIYRIDLTTKAVTTIAEIPAAALDGLEKDGDGWLTTDFFRGHLIRVAADGTYSILAQLAPGSADLGLNAATRTVAVPNLLGGFVAFALLAP